ncbi:MAG TPA: class I SAM-dependent methyltransferase [Burkholderiales bacterium]|nr:class I SAM-dependent methyltransferase [Burkholderiales bacterium]
MNTFKDHFSAQAADYARYRPRYPAALFEFLASRAPYRRLAWDCATGNGQVAGGLAPHFQAVMATDASASQIAQAARLPNVEFRVEPAESSSLADASVDLVTVGQALHWFDLEGFYAEVRRVARPGALVAAWCYNLLSCDPAVDRVVLHYYRDVVGPYWSADRVKVERGYRDLPFPFDPVNAPELGLEADWDLAEFTGYLGTWSAAQRYREARGADPREAIAAGLAAAWGSPGEKRRIEWPLHFRIGRA